MFKSENTVFKHEKMWTRAMVVVALFAFIISKTPVLAQENLEPIYKGNSIRNLFWSNDSHQLAFQAQEFEVGVYVNDKSWFQYDAVTNNLSNGNVWPFRPDWALLDTNLQPYRENGYETFAFQSSDEHYLVYATTSTSNLSRPLRIANLISGEIVDTQINAGSSILDTDLFNICWSQDSKAFVILTSSIAGHYPSHYYVSNYANDLSDASADLIDVIQLNQERYSVIQVFDLSDDGNKLLTVGTKLVESQGQEIRSVHLIIRDLANPPAISVIPQTAIDGTNVLAASFSPGDENKILVLTDNGIEELNLQDNSVQLVNSDVSGTWVTRARFSPDGNRIAVVREFNSSDSELYVLNLCGTDCIPTATVTPT